MMGMNECGIRIVYGVSSSAAFGDNGHNHETWSLPLMNSWVCFHEVLSQRVGSHYQLQQTLQDHVLGVAR